MEKEVKYIDLIFDNYMTMRVYSKDIEDLFISGIEGVCEKVAANSICRKKVAKTFLIKIDRVSMNLNQRIDNGYTNIDLLEDCNIAEICIAYNDDTTEQILLYKAEYPSDAISIDEDSVYIAITKKIAKGKKNVKDYFKI